MNDKQPVYDVRIYGEDPFSPFVVPNAVGGVQFDPTAQFAKMIDKAGVEVIFPINRISRIEQTPTGEMA